MNTDERDDEHLSVGEIRGWADSWRAFHCIPENAEVFENDRERAYRMVRFLLSLLDSHQGWYEFNDDGPIHSVSATSPEAARVMDGVIAHNRKSAHKIGSTTMRQRCVDRVREMGQQWANRVDSSDDPSFKYHYRTRADAALELSLILQSLTLESGEGGS